MVPNNRNVAADIIRILAMFFVIIMHTVYNFSLRPDFFATKLWYILEPVSAISKTCVLLFFMLSGYLVLNKKRTITENWQKTLQRIIIPLFSFSLINIVYQWFRYQYTIDRFIKFIFMQLSRMTDFPGSPLWFLVVLMFLYLLNPLWNLVYLKNEHKQLARYLTFLAFGLGLTATFIKFPANKIDTMFSNFTGWVGYAGFYLYGGLVRNKWIKHKRQATNLLIFALGFLLTGLGDFATGFSEVHQTPYIWKTYTGVFTSVPVTVMAIGLFNILINLTYNKVNKSICQFIFWLSGLSFGIYLTHTFVVSILNDYLRFSFDFVAMNVYIYILLNFSLVFFISLLLTQVIKTIPYFNKIIGE